MNEWLTKNRALVSMFAAGILLGAVGVSNGFAGFRFGGSEYLLINRASIPKSLSVNGKWFYEAHVSGSDLRYDKLTCKSILGEADISHGSDGSAISNEFYIYKATRRVCIDNQGRLLKVNIGWKSTNASVLPDTRRIVISLMTHDPNPRIGYIDGLIPRTDSEAMPKEFSGIMHYLNTKDQTYAGINIKFCKEDTVCANTISKQF
jgi:hypothetical protein